MKYIFPLSYNKKTPKKFFLALVIYMLIYVVGAILPVPYINLIISVYVFVGAGLLMFDYYNKSNSKKDNLEE